MCFIIRLVLAPSSTLCPQPLLPSPTPLPHARASPQTRCHPGPQAPPYPATPTPHHHHPCHQTPLLPIFHLAHRQGTEFVMRAGASPVPRRMKGERHK